MTLTLGTISFNDDVADTDGAYWYVDVDGWNTLPQRENTVTQPATHGGITVLNLYSPRQMTLTGVAKTVNAAGYWLALNKLQTVTNVLTRFTASPLLLTQSEDVDKYVMVVRTSLRTRCIDDVLMQFELTLRADDPFKYASTATTLVTSGNAVNSGTILTYPTFTLSASGTPTLTAGAMTWAASASLPSGTVIDFRSFSVMNGATSYIASVAQSSTWFWFEPGTTAVTSTVAGTWSWRSAWL